MAARGVRGPVRMAHPASNPREQIPSCNVPFRTRPHRTGFRSCFRSAPLVLPPRSAPAGPGDRAHLVEEGQRARLTLEDVADEVAERGLGLSLDVDHEAQPGERLDIESLVRLQQFQRLESQARPIVRRARTPLADDAAEWRDPAEALVRSEHAVALDAAVDLGAG